jgi:predicted RNA-binding Zn-ribbon protein involved in translation (DUF1610 family)
MTSRQCLVCKASKTEVVDRPGGIDGVRYQCPNCGDFLLSRSVVPRMQDMDVKDRAVLSRANLELQRDDEKPVEVHSRFIDSLEGHELPNPAEQLDRLVLFLGKHQDSPGTSETAICGNLRAKIGAISEHDEDYIIGEAAKVELIENVEELNEGYVIRLTLTGWQRYEELKRGATHSRTAFMAMQFNDATLDTVYANCFQPAVEETGFKLKRVDDDPEAGFIDDKLRVDIRMSRFLIADLTHGNQGAYWEAGFAEGLGKPVIYTCAKAYWDENKTHFDTNHHHTVIWEENDLGAAAEKLKATIRNTLPTEAKMPEE